MLKAARGASARVVRSAGAWYSPVAKRSMSSHRSADEFSGMTPFFLGRGGVIESNHQFITSAEMEECAAPQCAAAEECAAQPRLPKELLFIPSETPMLCESLMRSPSTLSGKSDAADGAKTLEVNGMRVFLLDGSQTPAGGMF